MIKFFRKIRYDLMEKNRVGKYLKYSLGEISLIMIGILLALQLNNWNEEQKNHKKEVANLRSLKSEMISTLNELKSDYSLHQINYQATVNVYQYIQTKPLEVDSMYEDFFYCVRFNYFFPKISTYETLKSGNLATIRSDSLRALITDVYESGYQRILTKVNTRRNAARILFPYYQKHFRTKVRIEGDSITWHNSRNKISIPNNYNLLMSDPEFETLIAEAITGRKTTLYDFENTINDIQKCIGQIDNYLMD